MKTKKWKYEVKFLNRILCAIVLLEFYFWKVSPGRYSISYIEDDYYLHTSSNNVLDIIGETLTHAQYTINTPI